MGNNKDCGRERTCPGCHGTGKADSWPDDFGNPKIGSHDGEPCPHCGGSGEITVRDGLRVYVAGPYKGGGTWGENLNKAINAGERLLESGHAPFIPHTHTALWDLVHPKGSETWLDIDFEWLAQCDALVRLDGKSNGADAEVQFADENGIPVYFGVESFLTAGTKGTGSDRS